MKLKKHRQYSDEWLEKELRIKKRTHQSVADEINVNRMTISRWAKKLGIPPKPRRTYKAGKSTYYKLLDDKKWLRELYIHERLSTIEIAHIVGCSKGAVHFSLKKHKIPIRSVQECLQDKNRKQKSHTSAWWRRRLLNKIGKCQFCGFSDERTLVLHHIDGKRTNNDIENFVLLCRNCHIILHYEQRGIEKTPRES